MTNCPNCGGVIHGLRCEYCGTEFRESLGDVINFIPIERPTKVFVANKEIPCETIENVGSELASEYIINDLARSLAKAIAPMMELRTTYVPEYHTQRIVGKIRVVEPDYRFW